MIETSLMVNDYPEPNDNDVKTYTFDCWCKVKIKVYAENEEEARSCCNLTDCEDYEIQSIEDIESFEVED